MEARKKEKLMVQDRRLSVTQRLAVACLHEQLSAQLMATSDCRVRNRSWPGALLFLNSNVLPVVGPQLSPINTPLT